MLTKCDHDVNGADTDDRFGNGFVQSIDTRIPGKTMVSDNVSCTHGVKLGTTVSQHAHRLPFLSQILVAVFHWHFQCFPIAEVPGHFQLARRAAPVRVHSPSWVLASLQHTTGAKSRGCSPRRGRRRRLQSDVSETTLLPTTKHLPAWMNCEVAVAGVCAAVVSAMVHDGRCYSNSAPVTRRENDDDEPWCACFLVPSTTPSLTVSVQG